MYIATKRRLTCTFLIGAFSFSGAVYPQAPTTGPGDHLNGVLRQMDAASLKFRSAEADFKRDFYQRVVRETTSQTGNIYFLRAGNGTEMGAVFNPPEAKTIEYRAGRLRLYDPGSNHLTAVDARTNQAQYESFLTLGFGGSGKDLERSWNITDEGPESMDDGGKQVQVEKLDLVAKEASARSTFTHITIWVDPARAISLKQQFFTPSDDIQTATYTHIRYNESINTKRYAIRTNSKTTQ